MWIQKKYPIVITSIVICNPHIPRGCRFLPGSHSKGIEKYEILFMVLILLRIRTILTKIVIWWYRSIRHLTNGTDLEYLRMSYSLRSRLMHTVLLKIARKWYSLIFPEIEFYINTLIAKTSDKPLQQTCFFIKKQICPHLQNPCHV